MKRNRKNRTQGEKRVRGEQVRKSVYTHRGKTHLVFRHSPASELRTAAPRTRSTPSGLRTARPGPSQATCAHTQSQAESPPPEWSFPPLHLDEVCRSVFFQDKIQSPQFGGKNKRGRAGKCGQEVLFCVVSSHLFRTLVYNFRYIWAHQSGSRRRKANTAVFSLALF